MDTLVINLHSSMRLDLLIADFFAAVSLKLYSAVRAYGRIINTYFHLLIEIIVVAISCAGASSASWLVRFILATATRTIIVCKKATSTISCTISSTSAYIVIFRLLGCLVHSSTCLNKKGIGVNIVRLQELLKVLISHIHHSFAATILNEGWSIKETRLKWHLKLVIKVYFGARIRRCSRIASSSTHFKYVKTCSKCRVLRSSIATIIFIWWYYLVRAVLLSGILQKVAAKF